MHKYVLFESFKFKISVLDSFCWLPAIEHEDLKQIHWIPMINTYSFLVCEIMKLA